jgi:hypothetical protein
MTYSNCRPSNKIKDHCVCEVKDPLPENLDRVFQRQDTDLGREGFYWWNEFGHTLVRWPMEKMDLVEIMRRTCDEAALIDGLEVI